MNVSSPHYFRRACYHRVCKRWSCQQEHRQFPCRAARFLCSAARLVRSGALACSNFLKAPYRGRTYYVPFSHTECFDEIQEPSSETVSVGAFFSIHLVRAARKDMPSGGVLFSSILQCRGSDSSVCKLSKDGYQTTRAYATCVSAAQRLIDTHPRRLRRQRPGAQSWPITETRFTKRCAS